MQSGLCWGWWLLWRCGMVSCFASVLVSACGQSSPVSPRPPHRGLAAARHWPLCAGLPVCPPRGRPQSGAKTRRLAAADIVGFLGYRRRNRGTKRGTTAFIWFVHSFEINCLRHLVESVNRTIHHQALAALDSFLQNLYCLEVAGAARALTQLTLKVC